MSKLAHAGESSTTSPGRAEPKARSTASCMLGGPLDRSAGGRKRTLDHVRIAADQHHRARRAGDGRRERREVLLLPVAARNQHDLAAATVQLAAKAGQGGDRRADIRALRIVIEDDAAHLSDSLDSMRQSGEAAQRVDQRRERQADSATECEGGEGVRGVVQSREPQLTHGDERRRAFGQPVLAEDLEQPEILRVERGVEPERDHAPAGRPHRSARGIVAVQDLDPVAGEDPRLRRGVGREVGVAVEVIGADIEHGPSVGAERNGALELEARELEHPDVRQRPRVEPPHQRRERGRRDVARHLAVDAGGAAHAARHRGHGALAVRAGDREQARTGMAGEEAREELDIADDLEAARARLPDDRRFERHARARRDQLDTVEKRLRERSGHDLGIRHRGPQRVERGRRSARIGHAHGAALTRDPARHRESGFAEPQHQSLASGERHRTYLSFRVDRPNSTSTTVMIQNRTTTCVSFHPPSS